MIIVSNISATIVALFFLGTFIWSALRTTRASGFWRLLHGASVIIMIAASYTVLTGNYAMSVVVGLVWLCLSLFVMFRDTSSLRWLAFVQFFLAMLLAAGLPFVTG